MKIIITDGYTLNPGDLSWEPLDAFGEVLYYDRTSPEEVRQRCSVGNIILTNKTPIDKATIDAAPGLRLIAVTATGYNMVDTEAARKRAIPVCNVPEYGTDSVAQHTFALLLELSNNVGDYAQSVRDGEWQRSPDFCYRRTPLIELKGKTLGLIGFGRIGQQVARIALAFDMRVLYNRRSSAPQQAGTKAAIPASPGMPRPVAMNTLFEESDFISLHCPLTPENHSFINARYLSLMKPTAFLINTSRGQLIHEADLATALRNKTLAGAALDVLATEPPPPGHPLTGLPNCLVTPHIAWMSGDARRRLLQTTIENVRLALAGTPQHVVNP
jgi:glycerate dehydrogenase